MKTLIQYFLLFLFVVSTMLYNTRFSYFTYQYHFNNKVFTENYCINKDKPALKCNGKCELSKLAKAAEKQEKNNKMMSENDINFIVPTMEYFDCFQLCITQEQQLLVCNRHADYLAPKNYPPPKLMFSNA